MKRISIIKNNKVTNLAEFETEKELSEWLDKEKLNKSFGENERELLDTPMNPVSEELKAIANSSEIVTDSEGNKHTSYKIPAEYSISIEDITVEVEARERVERLKSLGRASSKACEDALDLISGYNTTRQLTAEQITQMQESFAPIVTLLSVVKRAGSAHVAISQVVADGVIVTQEMKDDLLTILAPFATSEG